MNQTGEEEGLFKPDLNAFKLKQIRSKDESQ